MSDVPDQPAAVIPRPALLDPDRPLHDLGPRLSVDDRSDAEVLSAALRDSCRYADQLWDALNTVRQYLLDCLPPVPEGGGRLAGASPASGDDTAGWAAWAQVFAGATSVLCGPHGDSGFGWDRAQEEMRSRGVRTGAT